MADGVNSAFVPDYLLSQIPEAQRASVADQARTNFFFGLLGTRGGFGRSLLGAQEAATGTVNQYLTAAQNAAALAEAERKARLIQDQQAARASVLAGVNTNPNITPSAALGANVGRSGPTEARAGMVGAPNPQAGAPLSSQLLRAATDPRLLQIDPTFAGQLSTIAGQTKPTYERGQRIDPMAGGPKFVPNLAEGEEPLYDAAGNIVGTRNVAGAIKALSQRETTKRIAEAATIPEKVIDPGTGRTLYRSRAEMLGLVNRPGQAQAQATGAAIAEMSPFEKDVATQNVKSFETQREIARTGQNIVRSNDETLGLLDKGITGFAAEPRLQIARLFQAVGLGDGSVEATQGLVIDRGKAVLNTVKQLGAGVSISNSDRAFAEKLSGGDLALDENTIRRVIRIENETAFQAAKKFNNRVKNLAGKSDTFGGVPVSDYIVPVPALQYADEKAAADAKRRGVLEKGDIVIINGRRAEVQ